MAGGALRARSWRNARYPWRVVAFGRLESQEGDKIESFKGGGANATTQNKRESEYGALQLATSHLNFMAFKTTLGLFSIY
jgi:hypothetical protein